MNFLQRRVGGQINERGEQCERPSERVQCEVKIKGASDRHHQANDGAMAEAHASRGQRTQGGAAHVAIDIVLHDFIQSRGPARNKTDSHKRVQQSPGEGREAGLQAAEVISAPGGQNHQRGDACFREFSVVAGPHREGTARETQRLGDGAHAVCGVRSVPGTCSAKATGTCRQTWIERTTAVASNKAPTATWATVETTIGNSGCTLSLPQATRVRKAAKPRQSCVISNESIRIAGLRTASILE